MKEKNFQVNFDEMSLEELDSIIQIIKITYKKFNNSSMDKIKNISNNYQEYLAVYPITHHE